MPFPLKISFKIAPLLSGSMSLPTAVVRCESRGGELIREVPLNGQKEGQWGFILIFVIANYCAVCIGPVTNCEGGSIRGRKRGEGW